MEEEAVYNSKRVLLFEIIVWTQFTFYLIPYKAMVSPDSNMGSLSRDLRTWSDAPVRELSSIFRSLPWIRMPSAGRRSPGSPEAARGVRHQRPPHALPTITRVPV